MPVSIAFSWGWITSGFEAAHCGGSLSIAALDLSFLLLTASKPRVMSSACQPMLCFQPLLVTDWQRSVSLGNLKRLWSLTSSTAYQPSPSLSCPFRARVDIQRALAMFQIFASPGGSILPQRRCSVLCWAWILDCSQEALSLPPTNFIPDLQSRHNVLDF